MGDRPKRVGTSSDRLCVESLLSTLVAPLLQRFIRDDPTHVGVDRESIDDAERAARNRDDQLAAIASATIELQMRSQRAEDCRARKRSVDAADLDAAGGRLRQ